LVGAFLLFWMIDIVREYGVRPTAALRTFLVNLAVAVIGIAVCFATIYPTYNDAAPILLPGGISLLKTLAKAALLPAAFFPRVSHLQWGGIYQQTGDMPMKLLTSLVMFGSLLGLMRSPGALIAGLTALVAFALFFAVVYVGYYRHEALW